MTKDGSSAEVQPPPDLVLRRAFELPGARRRRLAAWEAWKQANLLSEPREPEEETAESDQLRAMSPLEDQRDTFEQASEQANSGMRDPSRLVGLPARRSGRVLMHRDPAREFEDIYDRMGQLMPSAFGGTSPGQASDTPWVPPHELSETDDSYVLEAELLGVNKDQVEVQLLDRELVIAGEVTESEEGRRHRSSRRTRGFQFRTHLPGDVKADAVTAQLADGLLTITVPKLVGPKISRRVDIT